MDHLQHLKRQIRQHIFGLMFAENLSLIGAFAAATYFGLPLGYCVLAALIVSFLLSAWVMGVVADYTVQPTQALWQTILHLSPTDHGIAAPNATDLSVGRELVTALTAQIYQLASVAEHAAEEGRMRSSDLNQNFIAENLPLPLMVLDPTETVTFANAAAAKYIGISAADLVGKNIYMIMDMSFPNEDTFDKWLKSVKIKNATASQTWERVRLNVRDNHPTLLFDLAAYYNRDNPDRTETILVMFDHTKQYSQDDQAVSFVALSVHELRTPLTLLRGYIEVFEEELDGKIDEELQGFMMKMRSQAEQLMAFVNNILNVARVDDDQLELQLQEEDWPTILKGAVDVLSLRAKVRGIALSCTTSTDLPPAAVDRLSIQEVISNLVDNAIKYSGQSKQINIETHLTKDGLIETTVQDFGVGISSSILPNLFTKFYRDHRNRAQIGGTGLGLYLSKAIVDAHGGNLWVRSAEGQGSVFGFTLIPYAQVKDELSGNDNQIVRKAHGWIKNHSLYRR